MLNHRILVVEDEAKIAALLEDYLVTSGYPVTRLDRGERVVQEVKRDAPDLILLDVMLPGRSGMDICREIRKFSRVPIIMITARVEEVDRLIGLELGADDYICKPFSPREVVARVKAVLRRVYSEPEVNKLVVAPLELDMSRHQAFIGDEDLKLTPSEFGVLRVMMARPNHVFSRSDLLAQVQGYDFAGYDRTIDTHIKNLRKKIAVRLPDREVISAVYGVGYKLNAPLE